VIAPKLGTFVRENTGRETARTLAHVRLEQRQNNLKKYL